MDESPQNIIWIQTAFLGDIVLTTAGMHLAAQQFPRAHQYLITTATGRAALRQQHYLTDIFVLDKSTLNIFRTFTELKRQLPHLDAARTVTLQPHASCRSSLLARYLGFTTITFTDSTLSFLATTRIKKNTSRHVAPRIAALLAPLRVTDTAIAAARPYLAAGRPSPQLPSPLCNFSEPLVTLAPGSQWGTKMWPIDNYCALSARLLTELQVGVVVLGSKQEIHLGTVLDQKLATQKNYWNLIGKTSLDDLRYLIPKSRLIITNDNAISHYSSAFNIPALTIFGATVPAFGFTPLAPGSENVETSRTLDCRPCSLHGPMVCPRQHFQCMRSISTDAVFQKAARLLTHTTP